MVDTLWIYCSLLISKVTEVGEKHQKQAPGTKSVQRSFERSVPESISEPPRRIYSFTLNLALRAAL